MADNQYRKYIEEHQQGQNQPSALSNLAGLGAVAGGGLAAFRFRRQIGETAKAAKDLGMGVLGTGIIRATGSDTLNKAARTTSSYMKALDHAATGASPLSFLRDPGRFNRRLEQSLGRSFDENFSKTQGPMGSQPLDISKKFDQMLRGMKTAKSSQVKQLRMDKITNELQDTMSEKMFHNLRNILNDKDDDFFAKPTQGKIQGLFEQYATPKEGKSQYQHSLDFASEIERRNVEKSLLNTLDTYKDNSTFGKQFLKDKGKQIEQTAMGEFKKGQTKQDSWFTKMMSNVGYEQMTVRDAIKHGKLDDGSMRIAGRRGEYRNAMMDSRLKQYAEQDRDVMSLIADEKVFINKDGKTVDLRGVSKGTYNALTAVRDNTQVPFLRFNPLDLMHWTSYQGVKEAPYMYMLRRGTIDPLLGASKRVQTLDHPMSHNQDAAVGTLARDYMYMNGSVYDVTTMEKVKENAYLASARFGAIPRALAGMGNLHRKDYGAEEGVMGFLKKTLDLGNQETESILGRTKSIFTKFDDPNWERNALREVKLMNQTGDYDLDRLDSNYRNVYSLLEQKTTTLSDDAADYLTPHVNKAYGDINVNLSNLHDEETIMGTMGRINAAFADPSSGIYRTKGISEQISSSYQKYRRNQTEFLKTKRIVTDGAPDLPEGISAVDPHQVIMVEALEDAKRLIHQHATRQLNFATGSSASSLLRKGVDEGQLSRKTLDEVRDLESLTTMRQWWDDVYEGSPWDRNDALTAFGERAGKEDGKFAHALEETVNSFTPIHSVGPGEKPPQHFGYVGFMTVNKTRGWTSALETYNSNLMGGNNVLKSGTKAALDILKQPFAGRKNLDDVSTLSLISYYAAERLDNTVAKVGLGLSQRNRGSMQSIIANQLGRRIVLPYAAIQQAQYLDGLTGDFVSDKIADTYVNMHQDLGWMKETLGINDVISKGKGMFAGSDQLAELPFTKVFNFATLGLFSDDRSDEELQQYYESGEDEIRKGRYWGIGSSTAWFGGKVDRYVPNWYRKAKSDYKFTETMYGSESEYWANHWMPTLGNPLAPIRHFITDPGYFEEKHREDRPYPVSGGVNELGQLPIIGPALNATVGRVLNPRVIHKDLEKSHRAYLEEINANVTSQYNQAGGGGLIQFMPGGGYDISYGELGAEGVPLQAAGFTGGTAEGSGVAYGTGGGVGYGVGTGTGSGGAGGDVRGQLTSMNISLRDEGGPSLGAGGATMRSVTSLNDLRDPDVVADLADIGSMTTVGGLMRDSFYSAAEVAGIYGFGTKSITGFQESGRGMTLDTSSRMMSYTRQWWDSELGSLDFRGGQLSEIFRRYVPRDPNKNYWNPIRNTMPDWLPGVNYFTDFQHGDPYVKIPHGEMRLPGKAYESLYKLHPDSLGEYGAFDRFRILGDVAPYSENYKFYRRVVSQMNQNGMLDDKMKDEYAEIRDQVSERKKKYNFSHRRFKNSDLNTEEVTVTEIIDANTFITKEYGHDNPIKLAGVAVKSDDAEAQALVSQFIYSGAKIKVGLDADPLFRVRDDMMNTMRAVVYTGNNEEMMPWYMSAKGQNLNNILANRSFGGFMGIGGKNDVSIKDDNSATATRALFSEDQVTVGKIWESLTHDVFPNLPAVGPIFDKFLQVRSPLETYKRVELYGKAWRPWNEPISGWIQPMLETITERNPLLASAQGAGIGWLGTRNKGTKWGTLIGAGVAGGLSSLRVFKEAIGSLDQDQDAWIPERRQKEREINEYFDRIKYAKYKGLYERASQLSRDEDGIDIDSLLAESQERGKQNKGLRRFLETQKKYLSMSKKIGYGDEAGIKVQLDSVRNDIKDIEADKSIQQLGPNAMLALRYRAEYESTLYGAEPSGDMQQIFRALPGKDREFFTEFMNAAPEEREEILRLVPKDQRKFYQAKWGMEEDKSESLQSYFSKHYLPDENWKGWDANTSLDSIKVKVIQNEGMEQTEFGFWGDDVKRAEQSGAEAIPMKKISHNIDTARLQKVLEGAGLSDVSVTIGTSSASENKVNLAMNLMRDRKDELVHELNNNLASLFS